MARTSVSTHRRPLIQYQQQKHNNDEATIPVDSHEAQDEEREPQHPTDRTRTLSETTKKSLRAPPVMTSSTGSSTTSTNTSCMMDDAAFRIRSNYLHRLGLETAKEQQLAAKQKSQSQQQILSEDIRHVEFLKQDYGLTDFNLSASSLPIQSVRYRRENYKKKVSSFPSLSAITLKKKRAVSFYPSVCVHAIPGRQLYSHRVQQTIWMMHEELRRSIAINSVEFMAEGMDPSKVLEESDFLYSEKAQSLIHPAHFIAGFQDIIASLESSMGGRPTVPPSPDHLPCGTTRLSSPRSKRIGRKARTRRRQDECMVTSCMVL